MRGGSTVLRLETLPHMARINLPAETTRQDGPGATIANRNDLQHGGPAGHARSQAIALQARWDPGGAMTLPLIIE